MPKIEQGKKAPIEIIWETELESYKIWQVETKWHSV